MRDWRFRKQQHLRSPADFQRVYQQRRRASDQHLLLYAAANDSFMTDSPVTRIGLSVSRKHGSAVVRNRIKRLLREAFRLDQHELKAGYDLILIPRQNSQSSLEEYRQSLRQLTEQLTRSKDEEQAS